MKLKDGRISILFNEEGLKIELYDQQAGIRFAEIKLTAEQSCQALSRLANTHCVIEVFGIENVGKKEIIDTVEFPMPPHEWKTRDSIAKSEVIKWCPDGWTPDLYFGSKNSFFQSNGVEMARTIIRRWE